MEKQRKNITKGMASRSGRTTELQMPLRRLNVIETSPERTKVWTEPPNKIKSSYQRVPVIYYLSRNGQLEHPHFIEVPLSNPVGLHLRDVINRLNFLRGNGIASMYSWSCKRSYKNGYVWHDLSENDFIYPAQGREYILKGSEIVEGALIAKCDETLRSAIFNKSLADCDKKDDDDDLSTVAVPRRRHQSWSSVDFHEYIVYTGENSGRAAADASTQTDDKRRRRRRPVKEIEEIEEEDVKSKEPSGNTSNEICTDEISPPPSDSSSETLENLMKADGRIILRSETIKDDPALNMKQISGRGRASTVLMQLLSCGSIGFRDCGAGDRMGREISLGSHQKISRGRKADHGLKDAEDDTVSSLSSGFGGRLKLQDKEYFSGSLIETKKEKLPALKRSSSYTADR